MHSQLADLQQTRKDSERQLADLHHAGEQEQRIRGARKRLRELEQQRREFESQAGDAAIQAELDKIRSTREARLRELEQAAAAADAMENGNAAAETRLAEMRAEQRKKTANRPALLQMRKHLDGYALPEAKLEKRRAELADQRQA